jgi:hypothetical protein
MAKNTMLKTRSVDNPYEVYANEHGWEWRVLKKYQADDHKPYARWFCAVRSPYTFGSWDYGDVYAQEVLDNATKLELISIEEV